MLTDDSAARLRSRRRCFVLTPRGRVPCRGPGETGRHVSETEVGRRLMMGYGGQCVAVCAVTVASAHEEEEEEEEEEEDTDDDAQDGFARA